MEYAYLFFSHNYKNRFFFLQVFVKNTFLNILFSIKEVVTIWGEICAWIFDTFFNKNNKKRSRKKHGYEIEFSITEKKNFCK